MLKRFMKHTHGTDAVIWDMPLATRKALLMASTPVTLRAKEILFHAGDRGDGCYYVRSGAVKASVIAKDGQERLLAILGEGTLIGELSLIDNQPRSASVAALRPCQLLHISKAAFFEIADRNPPIYRQALKLLAHRLRGTNDSVVAQSTVTVSGRVARAFIALANGLGDEQPDGRIMVNHKVTQTDIAGVAGVARENASRAVNDLLRTGVLSRVRGHYVIERPDDLLDMAEI